jgi:uncharacterized protein (DUF1697 family)
MPHYIAFLRAINVGGHTVKMERLRALFQGMGFAGVETFIASGNVVFEAPETDPAALKGRIEAALGAALGYQVATFLRTPAELAAIARHQPFPAESFAAATAFNLAFLSHPPEAEGERRLMALRTEIDDFVVRRREVYWLCRKKQSESTFSNAVLEKALGQPSTLRGMKTVQAMVAKYGPL